MPQIRSSLASAISSSAKSARTGQDCDLSVDFRNGVPPEWTFTRASKQTGVDGNGLLYQAAANVPAYISGEGVLLEPARTNLLSRSQEFDNASWPKSNATVTANATVAPDGTVTAGKLVEGATTGVHLLNRGGATAGVLSTFSVYAKAGERSQIALQLGGDIAYFNLSSGAVVSGAGASISDAGDGWWRCVITRTPANTNSLICTAVAGATSYTGDGTSGVYLWGAQLEVGSFATSYIPTTTATATRAATSLTKDHALPKNNFSVHMVARPRNALTGVASYPRILTLDDASGSNTNNQSVALEIGSGTGYWSTANNGVQGSECAIAAAYTAAGERLSIRGVRRGGVESKLFINGLSKNTTAASAHSDFTVAPSKIRLGQTYNGAIGGNLTVESLRIWHEAKSDAFLEALI